MSQPLIPLHTPYTAQELIDCGWVRRVRNAVVAHGNALRIGAKHEILAQCINEPDQFLPIMLPNGGTQLTDYVQCGLVADMLEGVTPIPEPAIPKA